MTDLIPRDAAVAEIEKWWNYSQSTWQSPMTILRAITAIDPACDHCGIDPAAIREAALREAAELMNVRGRFTIKDRVDAILTLIGEKK